MPESLFITGTDTDVGKTRVLCEMLKSMRADGVDAVGFKPVECGPNRADSRAIFEVCGSSGIDLETINPVWFKTPVAPTVAAELEGDRWDVERVLATFEKLKAAHDVVIVEGAGGWLVPINKGATFLVSDLAAQIGLPVVVVAANRLGCLNHTALTVNQIKRDGLECHSVILNSVTSESDVSAVTNEQMIRNSVSCPVFSVAYNGSVMIS